MISVHQTVSATGYRLSRKGVAVVAVVVGLGIGLVAGGSAVYWQSLKSQSRLDADAAADKAMISALNSKLKVAEAHAGDLQSATEVLKQQASTNSQQAMALAQAVEDAAKLTDLMPPLRSPTYAEPWAKLVSQLSTIRPAAQRVLAAPSSPTPESRQP